MKHIDNIKKVCSSGKYYVHYDSYRKYINFFDAVPIEIDELPEDVDFLFTIDDYSLDHYGDMCSKCKTHYPTLSFTGKYLKKNKLVRYTGYINSCASFSCGCENGIIKWDNIPELNVIIVYTGDEFIYEALSLKFNLKIISAKVAYEFMNFSSNTLFINDGDDESENVCELRSSCENASVYDEHCHRNTDLLEKPQIDLAHSLYI
jgi:hypothetical protein